MQSHECMQALCPLLSVPNPSFKWHECEKSSPNYTTLWKCVIGTSVSHNTVTAIWEYQRRDPCHMGSAWQPWDGMRWDGMGWGGVGWDGGSCIRMAVSTLQTVPAFTQMKEHLPNWDPNMSSVTQLCSFLQDAQSLLRDLKTPQTQTFEECQYKSTRYSNSFHWN